jgi:hypothetical protein
MNNILINFLSRHSIAVTFTIVISLVQFTRSNVFCQSTKSAHSFSSMSKIRSDIILSIEVAFMFYSVLRNPNW